LDVGLPYQQQADLYAAGAARGLVVFAHGNGGGSHTTWYSRDIAQSLQRRGLSALLFDLLSAEECADREAPYDIDRLAARLVAVLDALPAELRALPLGLLGSDTGAAASIVAAVRRAAAVRAIVSRGGRPELVGVETLGALRAPTLLIVGAADTEVLAQNRRAYLHLRCEKRVEIVPRATHLFLEAGALDTVARLAGDWFATHLAHNDSDHLR